MINLIAFAGVDQHKFMNANLMNVIHPRVTSL